MHEIKYNYDREADVLYVSFGHSEHITGVELSDNILLRLDTGKATGEPPRAVGLTFTSFARMMECHRDRPLIISLEALRNLPEDLWQAVLAVLISPPVSNFLSVKLAVVPQIPPLPELTMV
ncbi:MAG: DUF2283 domain-containing protein [Candidatus Tectomicrobia bacterium]|uniref:DUF2283 domain-containing protein n=1 Tax=Tectimicrobiota bacterium TaxID=2528274 RepID=A0A932FWK8_UNCTE|nr:DUF2283 domain-containing protein [Candidatus Tectomicrobia bacterium]